MSDPRPNETMETREIRPFASLRASEAATEAGKREVDLYVRTYTTLLQSTGDISVSSFEPAHITAAPSLHAGVEEPAPDLNAFIYSLQRLPSCIVGVRRIYLGQSVGSLAKVGVNDLTTWTSVAAPGRRRRWIWDGGEVLAAYVASTSDLDDLIPTIVAFQIEWNKFFRLFEADPDLATEVRSFADRTAAPTDVQIASVGQRLLLSAGDWDRLRGVWNAELWTNLSLMATARKRMTLRMLGSSYLGYTRATRSWWNPIGELLAERGLQDRPVFFVSSNMHSMANVLSGVVRRRTELLTDFVRSSRHPELLPELERHEAGEMRSSYDNMLYFAARDLFAGPGADQLRKERQAEEVERGIDHIVGTGVVDVGVQIIDLAKLDVASFDPRLNAGEGLMMNPAASDAIVLNVNYPLGLGAYHLMTQVAAAVPDLRGIYILGKAATLNGRIGDVMLANVVYDEHSGNTYWFENCFDYEHLAPYLVYGAALDNQKAITVKGTYLQNRGYLDFFYRENFTVLEMEAGPYLSAIYEDAYLQRHPANEAVSLSHAERKIDLGIIHYASDTPYTRAQTLGARGMSYYGMDSTYASTIAILRQIFTQAGIYTESAPGEAGPW